MNAEVYIEAAAHAIAANLFPQPADWRESRRTAKAAVLATIDTLIKDLGTAGSPTLSPVLAWLLTKRDEIK